MNYSKSMKHLLATCLLMKKAARLFLPFYATSDIKYFCHAIFGHGMKWPKVDSDIYLSALVLQVLGFDQER